MYELFIYETEDHRFPFEKWLNNLADLNAKIRIRTKLDQLRLGHLGNAKSTGDGVFELKIDYGPGYRIYFGLAGKLIILLLCGGIKKTQSKDIKQARAYWINYRSRRKDETLPGQPY